MHEVQIEKILNSNPYTQYVPKTHAFSPVGLKCVEAIVFITMQRYCCCKAMDSRYSDDIENPTVHA